MRIIEQRCTGKHTDQSLNEDALIVTDKHIAVIDGATSCCSDWGIPGGLLAKRLLTDYIINSAPEENGFELIKKLNAVLFDYQQTQPELFVNPGKRLMASILIFSASSSQLWSYGDCHYLINNRYFHTNKLVDDMNAELRSFINNLLILEGTTEAELLVCDRGAAEIKQYLNIQPRFANVDHEFGYPILDGGTVLSQFFVSHQLEKGDEVVMATDGYPFLEQTLERSEKKLCELKEHDPLLIRELKAVKGFYPNLISFDDRTYIRFIV